MSYFLHLLQLFLIHASRDMLHQNLLMLNTPDQHVLVVYTSGSKETGVGTQGVILMFRSQATGENPVRADLINRVTGRTIHVEKAGQKGAGRNKKFRGIGSEDNKNKTFC